VTVQTTNSETYEVYLADELHSDLADWTRADTVFVNRLERRTLPGIDAASFVYHVGDIKQHHRSDTPPGTYNPLATLARSYILVRVFSHNPGPLLEWEWYGVIDRKSVDEIAGNVCNADQYFYAYGLAHELTKHLCTQSRVAAEFDTDDDALGYVINRAIGFNLDPLASSLDLPGNRHTTLGNENSRLFSPAPNRGGSNPCAASWLPSEALEYVLTYDAPPQIQWRLSGQLDAVNVRELPQVPRERRKVLDVLFDLIGRKNGLYAKFEVLAPNVPAGDDPDRLCVHLVVGSTSPDPIVIGPYTFPAHPDQRSMITNQDRYIDTLEIAESGFDAYDQIVYEGEYITTTATVQFKSHHVPSWTTADETAVVESDPDSANPNLLERAQKADDKRSREEYRDVFRRFMFRRHDITPLFDMSPAVELTLSPDPALLDTLVTASDIKDVWAEPGFDLRHDVWRQAWLPYIPDPLLTADNRNPFVVFPIDDDLDLTTDIADGDYITKTWQRGDQLDFEGGGLVENGRRWTVDVEVGRVAGALNAYLDEDCWTGPGVFLNVKGGPQWLIAYREMEDAEHVLPQHDPRNSDVKGLAWQHALLTATIESDQRVFFAWPAAPVAVGNMPLRIRRVTVPDMRLDVALPGTVTGIQYNGTLQTNGADGRIYRDDRYLLKQLARADFVFSGPDRRTMNFKLNTLSPGVVLGTLVSSVQTPCGTDTTDTLVTSLDFDFQKGTVTGVTSYEDVDVVDTFGGRATSPRTLPVTNDYQRPYNRYDTEVPTS
jgi:hypothetical protein